MHKKIAILAGDGIGPEVMQQTLRVLDTIAEQSDYQFEYINADIGGAAYQRYQNHCPQETLEICDKADAILFGSVGGPSQEQHLAKWQNCEANSILKLRKHFQFNINIRPISVFPTLAMNCPLQDDIVGKGIDIVIFRELNGGIYFGKHERIMKNERRFALDECVYNEDQIRQIAIAAFDAARLRSNQVYSVDKANVLATSKLWREVVSEVARDYPDVELTHLLIDNCVMQMVINPQQFDVVVTDNMFGDILSDLAAALPGSLGLIPSASLNAQGKGLYEPSGGSAPDIAGKNIANPCAQILSAALMLRHSFAMDTAAKAIEQAVYSAIANGVLTADLVKDQSAAVTTQAFTDAVIEAL